MYFVYSLLLALGFLVLLPRFILDAFRHGKYAAGFRERLGSLSPVAGGQRPTIWLHCVSVGETQAARPLVKSIKADYPSYSIVVSTITLTGQRLASELFKNEVEKVFYFPFDWRWTVRRTLDAINPQSVLLMETELWPGFLRECKSRKIPVAIINGRLSDQSFRRYRLVKGFMKRVLGSLSLALMQTEADAARLEELGMAPEKTFIVGNLKFDAGSLPGTSTITNEFKERFNLGEHTPTILAASTHSPEERIVLDAFKLLTSDANFKARLIIAPRHPERFAEVAILLKASGFTWTRRTTPADSADAQCQVILLDSIGELQNIYGLASIVFVGGSIAKTGGHNILEPAGAGASVVTGPYTHNFRSIVGAFVEADALIQLPRLSEHESAQHLAHVFAELLANPTRRNELAARAQKLVTQNRGASERTMQLLAPMFAAALHTPDSSVSLQTEPVTTT